MLKVENIHISFKYPVIENGNLEIKPYEITLLTGKSGTGKSSLLNVLGLLDQQSQYNYIFNNQMISNRDMNELRRLNISYVFQDYNLIEDISIQDNFKAMFNIAGMKYNKKEMIDLLNEVSIDIFKIKSKGKSLSGGEKQRVAIALSLVKKPKLLLLDEPTANLDETNENQVISILHSLKDKGMMIVVATHHPEVYNAEHIYNIEDHQIIEVKQEDNDKSIQGSQQKSRKFNPFTYALSHISSHMIIYSILLLIMTGAMFNVEKVYMSAHQSSLETKEYINSISDNEILIINNKDLLQEGQGLYYFNESKKIDSKIIDKISKLEGIETVYPYFKYTPTFSCDIDGNDLNPQNDSNINTVKYGNKNVNLSETFGNALQVASCNSKYKTKQCFKSDDKITNGVFISSRLAKQLGISKLDNTEISFYMPIFLGYQYNESYGADENGVQTTDTVPSYPVNVLFEEMTYKVQGIYEESSDSAKFYDLYNFTDIYVDYHEFQRLHNQAVSDDKIMSMYQKYMDYYFIDTHNSQFTLDSPMYVVKVKDIDKIDSLVNQINNLGYDINLKTKAIESNLQNASMNDFYYSILMLPVIILGVISILIVVLYTYTLHQRKKELSFLKASGIKSSFILPIVDLIIVLIVSVPITTILSILYNEYSGGYLTYDLSCFMINVIAIAIILLLCFIANKLYYRHTDIIQELRSK